MKSATIHITPRSDEQAIIESLDRTLQRPEAFSAEESLLLQDAKACARDFVERARKQYAAGTTIQISKEFQFSHVTLSLRLDSPGRQNVLDQIVAFFRRV